MKMRSVVTASPIGFMCLLMVGIAAEAAELNVLSTNGMRAIMEDLRPKFERATGHTLAITFDNTGAAVKRVQGGETADVVIIVRSGIDGPVKDGKVTAGTETDVARDGIGVVVRKGAPKPDISSPEALKRTLLAAKSISYSDPAGGGASGIHFAKVLDRLGIANEMQSKTVFPKPPGPGAAGRVVANGEAEIGVEPFQVLMPVAGIEIVGPLPGDLQTTSAISVALIGGTKNAEAAKALVDFLRTPEAAAVIKAKGMEPVAP